MEQLDKPLIIDGISYPTSEHAYQAMRSTDENVRRKIAAMPSPYDAKRYWRDHQPESRADWDNIKLDVMRQVLELKFAPGTRCHKELMATGKKKLVEYNNWGDKYWGAHVQNLPDGTVHISGENHLGTLQMEVRERHRVKETPNRAPTTPVIFIGGSISIKDLPAIAKERVDNIITKQLSVMVGDANGADTAFQKHLAEKGYRNVRVFCTGSCRNNIGNWGTRNIDPNLEQGLRVQHEAKDRKMAKLAHFGLMLWDGKSMGTLTNILNLLSQNKKSVVFFEPDNTLQTIGHAKDLSALIDKCDKRDVALFDQKLGLQQRLEKLQRIHESPVQTPQNETNSRGYAR